MEYGDDDRVAESVPEFGAIFMSSTLTKKECFKRKILALPYNQAEFVKKIKVGMVLFLFEFKKRQLFGVYQASSDGAMDIVPHAFSYPGRHYPAQVRFTPIWYCYPLSEREFKDAIIENYYSAKKFTFGLSENQVHRLLFLFSSRKMRNEMVPRPVGTNRRSVGDDGFELSERGYRESTENDEFNHAAFSGNHANSFVEEDEELLDDRVNNEGKVYPSAQGDFLAKRRRIDKGASLLENDMDGLYNYGSVQTFETDSPMDLLDEVSNLTAVRQLLAVEKARKQNQMDKIRKAVLSSESMMDPLDVRTDGDDRFMQRNRLFDEYYMGNGFLSERYEKPLATRKHADDYDRFLFDDSVQRNQNIHDLVKPTVYDDGNLSLRRQELQQPIEDQKCSMDQKLEKRYHLDGSISPFRAFEHKASLLYETSLDRRLPINNRIDNEPNIVPYDVDNRSSAKFSRPLHYSHRITPDRKYPIVEGRLTENLIDDTLCSATSTRDGGYFERVGSRIVDVKDFHAHIGPDISFGCSSSSDKLLPEKGLSQLNASRNFGLSRATFDDATITRATPYIPEHLKFTNGFGASMAAAKQNPSLRRENPQSGSQEDFYSSYKNRLSSPYALESEKSRRSLDIATEFGNNNLPTNISVPQRSFCYEATAHVDLHTSVPVPVPVDHRGSLFSKPFLARPDTDHEKNRERGFLFAYTPKSGKHFDFDENPLKASQQEMDKLAGKDFISSEAIDPSSGKYHHSERDLTHCENQLYGIPSNMNCQVNHENFEVPPHFASNVNNRKSVFSRLTSREEIRGGGEDRNESGSDSRDCFMAATADQVMKMLRQSNNKLSPNKANKSRVIVEPKHREIALGEKQVHNHIEIKSSAVEKKLKDHEHLPIEGNVDEVPKETRIMDFKRRSDTKKDLVGASNKITSANLIEIKSSAVEKKLKDHEHLPIEGNVDEVPKEARIMDFKRRSDTKKYLVGASNKITSANAEAGNPMKMTLKRKKLVRPVFRKTESGTDNVCSNQNSLQVSGQILENFDNRNCGKVISICDSELPDDNAKLNNVLVSHAHQSMDCDIKEHSSPKEQNDIGVPVLPSSSTDLTKEHKPSVVVLDFDSSQGVFTELNKTPMDCDNIKELSGPQEQKDIKINVLPSSSNELKEHEPSLVLGLHIDNGPEALTEISKPFMDSNIKEHSSPKEQNDISIDVLPFSSVELTTEHKSSIEGLHIDNSSQALLAELHKPSMDCDNVKELSGPKEQKDMRVRVLPSSSTELTKEHKSSNVGLHIDNSSQAPSTELHKPPMDCDNLKEPSSPDEQNDIKVHVLSSSSSELTKGHRTSIVGLHIDNSSQALLTEPSMGCNNVKEHSGPEEPKDINVSPFSSTELKEHKMSVVGLHIDNSSQNPLTEISLHKAVDIQTSGEDILSKNVDSTASSSSNLEESSSVRLELGDCCLNNPIMEKGQKTRMVKRRKKIIRKVVKKIVKKVNKAGTEPLLNESDRVSRG